MNTRRRLSLPLLALALIATSALVLATPASAQWGYWGPGYGGYGGYGGPWSYGYGGEGCGNLNCEGDGWDGGYSDMKDKENAASQDEFDREATPARRGKLCKSKTPTYNDWGDFTGWKPVMIPCKNS